MSQFRVCTYNIRYVLDRWNERQELLHQELVDANADLYALQEVNIGGLNVGQPKQFIKLLNQRQASTTYDNASQEGMKSYHHFDSPGARNYFNTLPVVKYLFTNPIADLFYDCCALFNEKYLSTILGPYIQVLYHNELLRIISYVGLGTAWVFGTSMLLNTKHNFDIVKHDLLKVGGWRAAQSIEIAISGKRVLVVNVHLSSHPDHEQIRIQEMTSILAWIDAMESKFHGVVIMGDFNCLPVNACYKFLTHEHQFQSVYKAAHGEEPLKTFHQDHECPTKDIDHENTMDYIMIKGNIAIDMNESVRLIGTKPSKVDSTIYPSDHYGLVATLKII